MPATPPATLEGWFALHQVFQTDWAALHGLSPAAREAVVRQAEEFASSPAPGAGGWSAAFRLVGGGADWMFVHFRPTLEELGDAGLRLRKSDFGRLLHPVYDYLSVTEAGLYHATAESASEAEPGSEAFQQALAERADAELRSPHIRSRLFPEVPEGMRYISFYPMTKRRVTDANWYTLPIAERNRLMREHGMTGRRFAGRIFQVITGSVGFDDWEWGVTLFAADPLEFKRIVTEMRYDEASAVYGEFGEFFTGIEVEPGQWAQLLATRSAG